MCKSIVIALSLVLIPSTKPNGSEADPVSRPTVNAPVSRARALRTAPVSNRPTTLAQTRTAADGTAERATQEKSPVPRSLPPKQVIARGGDLVVTGDELAAILSHEHARPDNANTARDQQEMLKNILTIRALATQARAKHLDERGDIRYRIEHLLADELIYLEVDSQVSVSSITDNEIQTYYEAHHDQFVLPETLTAHGIFIAPKTPNAPHLSKEVAAMARSNGADLQYFQTLVQKYSNRRDSQLQHGWIGTFRGDRLNGRPLTADERIARAALTKLTTVGDVTEPIETGTGYQILRLSGRRPEYQRTLSEVRDEIRFTLYKLRRTTALAALMERALPPNSLFIDTEALHKLIADRNKATK